MQFSEPDFQSKNGEAAHWTVVWDSWTLNQPLSSFALEVAKHMPFNEQRTELIGHAAPEISGQTLTGQPFQLSKEKGKVVVLDFWRHGVGRALRRWPLSNDLKATLMVTTKLRSGASPKTAPMP